MLLHVLPKLARREVSARACGACGQLLFDGIHGAEAAVVTSLSSLFTHLTGQLLASHRCQKLDEIRGGVQLILPRRRPDEKTCEHRLANIHRVEGRFETRISQ